MTENDGTEDGRERGFLTPQDRAYLRGETEYEYEQSAINARRRIRERIRNAILDFDVVLEYLPEDDLRQLVEEAEEAEETAAPREFLDGLVDTVAFVIFCVGEFGSDFETVATAAIRRHAEKVNLQVENIDVDVEMTYRDIFTNTDRLEKQFENRQRGLSMAELGLLIEKGVINEKEALEYRIETSPNYDDIGS